MVETAECPTVWIPDVEDHLKPNVGSVFNFLEHAIEMYGKYAAAAGFDTRLSTQKRNRNGVVTLKYVLCSKAGYPHSMNVDTLCVENSKKTVRNSSFKVTGCGARVIFKLVDGRSSYMLREFKEEHNHPLNTKEHKHLSRKHRKLDIQQQIFIQKVSTSNIGATKAHHIYTGIHGSAENTHGTICDFKNFRRDINCFIGSSDAQMLVNKMQTRKECIKNFFFEYQTENSELSAMFWADETGRCNYKEFGDIISFDATYRTNRYNMIFVPFTAIDNNKKSVTLCAGMLMNETAASYEWLLRSFLKAFGAQPRIVVTDQDAAMRKAIESVFNNSKHRLCMWHITQKLPAKVPRRVFDNSEFKHKFNGIVWNLFITPDVFDKKWNALMEEFCLIDNEWLKHMYDIRRTWIPAYFIDLPMSGLMRTTSRSESENSFFAHFANSGSTLVHFMMSFESAMERQGRRIESLDHQTHNHSPRYMTPLPIERHACLVYTRTIFLLVQKEIYSAVWSCCQTSVISDGNYDFIVIKEKRQYHGNKTSTDGKEKGTKFDTDEEVEPLNLYIPDQREFDCKVVHNKEDATFECSCLTFVRYGILCRHIHCVFKNLDMEEIPQKYIVRRWRRDLIPAGARTKRTFFSGTNHECERLGKEANCIVDDCLRILGEDENNLSEFVEKLRSLKHDVESEFPNTRAQNKTELIEKIVGVSKPDVIDVQNPPLLRYKGCGRDKRLKSAVEIGMEVSGKPKRKCGRCGKMTNKHDKRNCEKKEAEKAKAKAMAEVLQQHGGV